MTLSRWHKIADLVRMTMNSIQTGLIEVWQKAIFKHAFTSKRTVKSSNRLNDSCRVHVLKLGQDQK